MTSSASSVIGQRLAEKRAQRVANQERINTITRQNEILDAEIRAWEDALRLVTSETGHSAPSTDVVRNNVTLNGADKRRGPRGGGPWRLIMPEMVREYPRGEFTFGDIEAAGEIVGKPIKLPTARSQMANYVNAGWLTRVREGHFRFTEMGLAALANLSNAPDAQGHLDAEPPAVGDDHAAGAPPDDVHSVTPKASNDATTTREIDPL